MTMRQIKNEGIGDSLKTAGKAATGLAGQALTGLATTTAGKVGALATGFGRAVGFDASQLEIGDWQKSLAKKNFVGTFTQKISGFISATVEAFKDDLAKLQKIQQQQQQQQQQTGYTTPGGIIVPGRSGARTNENMDFENLYRRILNEDQAIDNHIQNYSSIISNAISQYMGGQVGNLSSQIDSTSKSIVNKILNNQNYSKDISDLGSAIFDNYYKNQRTNFVKQHPAANTPLSYNGEQVLDALKKLPKKEQQIVVKKLEQGGNLY